METRKLTTGTGVLVNQTTSSEAKCVWRCRVRESGTILSAPWEAPSFAMMVWVLILLINFMLADVKVRFRGPPLHAISCFHQGKPVTIRSSFLLRRSWAGLMLSCTAGSFIRTWLVSGIKKKTRKYRFWPRTGPRGLASIGLQSFSSFFVGWMATLLAPWEHLLSHFILPGISLFFLYYWFLRSFSLCRTQEWSDQSGSAYRNWRLGQPDNFGGRQNCTATHLGNAGLWSDEECSKELPFVCYRDDGERLTLHNP